MKTDLLEKLLVIDWPEDCTSHKFILREPPVGVASNNRMTWHLCTLCGSYKLVGNVVLSKNKPAERIICRTIPYSLTSVCPQKEGDYIP